MKNSTIFLAFLILLSSPAKGQDFGKGLAALSKNDFATALSEWVPLANDGNTSAQYHLGIMYRNGKGVSKDYTEALKWFRLAAKQDNIDQHLKFVFMSSNINAQITLGKMYEDGQGVSQDYTEALKWYLAAANNDVVNVEYVPIVGNGLAEKIIRYRAASDVARAKFRVGLMYENARGVPKDYAEAMKWFSLAARQGNANAQERLGIMYENARGVPKDYAEAMKWFSLAARQGNANAQERLGIMYENGLSVLQDYVLSLMWYNVGGINGATRSKRNSEYTATIMTSTAVEKAQAMARECISSAYEKCGY